MRIQLGYDLAFNCPQETPAIFALRVHPSRQADLETADTISTSPILGVSEYLDGFGNLCSRITLPAGTSTITSSAVIRDSGAPDIIVPDAIQHDIESLPEDTLLYLLASRYCDTERLSAFAWSMFGSGPATSVPSGWRRVQDICDFVHNHLRFDYQQARSTRTASEGHVERVGVCRDFAHLAIALCRCMNIPARYCTGYLGDIGVPQDPAPMDFSAWFEAYIGGGWYTFDARHNQPRIGRVPIARGRDAADVAIMTAFGAHTLLRFAIQTYEVEEFEGAVPVSHAAGVAERVS